MGVTGLPGDRGGDDRTYPYMRLPPVCHYFVYKRTILCEDLGGPRVRFVTLERYILVHVVGDLADLPQQCYCIQ